jgi:hypothetical protein
VEHIWAAKVGVNECNREILQQLTRLAAERAEAGGGTAQGAFWLSSAPKITFRDCYRVVAMLEDVSESED